MLLNLQVSGADVFSLGLRKTRDDLSGEVDKSTFVIGNLNPLPRETIKQGEKIHTSIGDANPVIKQTGSQERRCWNSRLPTCKHLEGHNRVLVHEANVNR